MAKRGMSVRTKKGPWETVGGVGVDSGHLMLADPCYVLPEADGLPAESDLRVGDMPIQVTYDEYTKRMRTNDYPLASFPFGIRRALVVSTGFGDGVYPVQVRYATIEYLEGEKVMRRERRLAEMRIKFL